MARNPSNDGIAPLAEGALAVGFDLLQGNASVAGLVEPSGPLAPHALRDNLRQKAMNLRAIDAITAPDGSIARELKLASLRRIANPTR